MQKLRFRDDKSDRDVPADWNSTVVELDSIIWLIHDRDLVETVRGERTPCVRSLPER
jgi:hypothetical protein